MGRQVLFHNSTSGNCTAQFDCLYNTPSEDGIGVLVACHGLTIPSTCCDHSLDGLTTTEGHSGVTGTSDVYSRNQCHCGNT